MAKDNTWKEWHNNKNTGDMLKWLQNSLIIALHIWLVQTIVTTVPMTSALGVHLVALHVWALAWWTPQQTALVSVCSTWALVAKRLNQK